MINRLIKKISNKVRSVQADEKETVSQKKEEWTRSMNEHLRDFCESDLVKGLDEKSVCIDCGANVGSITEVFREKGAKVYAFEPNPEAFSVLEDKFKEDDSVVLYNKAVGVKDEKLRLYKYQYHEDDELFWSMGGSTYKSKDDVDPDSYVEVDSISLVEFIKELPENIDVLKLDIEGGEYDILYEMIINDLHKKIKNILVETHDRHIPEIIPKGKKVRELIEKKEIKNIDLDWI